MAPTYIFFQIMVTFLSYISNACHSLSGVAEWLQHTCPQQGRVQKWGADAGAWCARRTLRTERRWLHCPAATLSTRPALRSGWPRRRCTCCPARFTRVTPLLPAMCTCVRVLVTCSGDTDQRTSGTTTFLSGGHTHHSDPLFLLSELNFYRLPNINFAVVQSFKCYYAR